MTLQLNLNLRNQTETTVDFIVQDGDFAVVAVSTTTRSFFSTETTTVFHASMLDVDGVFYGYFETESLEEALIAFDEAVADFMNLPEFYIA